MWRSRLFGNPDLMGTPEINAALRAGEELEEKGNAIGAYFLYRGLVEANPTCKACQSHMGTAGVKLRHAGIKVEVEQVVQSEATINKEVKIKPPEEKSTTSSSPGYTNGHQ